MIEDKELRNLFKIESEERLQHLDDGFLRLEKTPADPALLDELFREAHSLKGAARMIGLTQIQDMAHQLEDAMGAARKGESVLQPDAVAAMYQTLEQIRGLVRAEVEEPAPAGGGEGSGEGVPAPGSVTAEAAAMVAPAGIPAAVTAPAAAVPPQPESSLPPRSETFYIETIRVDPKKLDALLTQAGELTVTKIRIARRLAEINRLLDYCEEWDRAVQAEQPGSRGGPQIAQHLEFLQEGLSHLRNGAYEDSARLDFVADQLEEGIRALRLLPMSTLFVLFPRMVHDLARDQHKEVELVVEGNETVADKRVLEEMKDPLMHMLRNAVDHGIEPPEQRSAAGKPRYGTVRIKATQTPATIIIEVSDDGRGLDIDAIRRTALKRGMHSETELAGMNAAQIQSLILQSGFSTSSFITDVSGRGVGLDVVRNNVERLKGTLEIDSVTGKGVTLRAQLPISLATVQVLIVSSNGRRYALPVEYVQFSHKLALQEMYSMEGRLTASIDGQPVSMAGLDELLGTAEAATQSRQAANSRGGRSGDAQSTVVCVILNADGEHFGVMVDEIVDELEVMLKPQGKLLKRVRNIAGATILDTGEVCMVLNPSDLLKTLCSRVVTAAPVAATEAVAAKKVLLLAEDSITTRTQEKRILEGAGYEVVVAVDGMDAFNKLGLRTFDGVVSDVTMPNMTGLELAAKIRANRKYAELPIILVTSLVSEEDKRRGLEAGANAYISKPEFDQRALLDSLRRLV